MPVIVDVIDNHDTCADCRIVLNHDRLRGGNLNAVANLDAVSDLDVAKILNARPLGNRVDPGSRVNDRSRANADRSRLIQPDRKMQSNAFSATSQTTPEKPRVRPAKPIAELAAEYEEFFSHTNLIIQRGM
jgi:hypothetical protein